MEEFPGNSIGAKIEKEAAAASSEESRETGEREKRVVKTKKSLGIQVKEIFFAEGRSFKDHLIQEVAIPMIKDLLVTAVDDFGKGLKRAVEQRIHSATGGDPRATTSYGTGRPTTNYGSYSKSTSTTTRREREEYRRPVATSPSHRRSDVVGPIVVDTRDEAQEILKTLDAIIDKMGAATVGDLYELVRVKTTQSDDFWGWTSVRNFEIEMVVRGEKYEIVCPRPKELE